MTSAYGGGGVAVAKQIKNPLVGSRYQGKHVPYSTWTETILDSMTTSENPEAGRQLYNQGQDIYWPQYIDWAIQNPLVLPSTLKMYASDQGGRMMKWFNLVITDKTEHRKTIYRVDPQLPQIGTRKTEGEIISSTITFLEGHSEYRQLGAEFDYYHLKTSDGRRDWDTKLQAIVVDMFAAIDFQGLNMFANTPDAYRIPERGFAYMCKPMTADDVFDREQETFGAVSRQPFAIWEIFARSSRMFKQFDMELSEVVISMTDAYMLSKHVEVNIMFDKAGNGAIANKNLMNMPSNLAGIEVTAMPFVETDLHNNTDEYILMSPIATGSHATFVDRTRKVPSSEYRSFMRNIEYVSWKSNTFDKYPFNEHFSHVAEFMRRPSEEVDELNGSYGGDLDVGLLMNLAEDGASHGNNIFVRTGCVREGNEAELHPLLRYIRKDKVTVSSTSKQTNKPVWFAAMRFGSVSEESCKTEHLIHIYETMHYAITATMSDEEKQKWTMLTELVNDPNGSTIDPAAIEDMVRGSNVLCEAINRVHQLVVDHPVVEKTKYGNDIANFKSIAEEMYKFKTHYLQDVSASILNASNIRGVTPTAANSTKYSTDISNLIAAFLKNSTNVNNLPVDKQIELFDDRVPTNYDEREPRLSDMARRYLSTYLMSGPVGFAARLVLLQTINLPAINTYYKENVGIPLGGKNIRFRERQWMKHYLMMSHTMGPKMGDWNFSGFNAWLAFSANNKQFSYGMEASAGFINDDDRKFMWMRNVAGGPIIGGKGNGHVDMRAIVEGNYDMSVMMQDMELNNKSNVSIITSYNSVVEEEGFEHRERNFDVRGFYQCADFPGRLHYSPEDFKTNRTAPMYNGQFMFNKLIALSEPSFEFDVVKLNHRQICDRRSNNFHCHQTSVRLWDPVEGFMITKSTHPWGEQLPGLREFEQGITRVSEKENSAARVYAKKLKPTYF